MKTQLRRAFTLIELLTVIAIIAILTAIIFPVFATVRENARQSSSLSNLHAISSALGQFQLDNHKNPDVLFGYVYYQYQTGTPGGNTGPAVAMDKAYAQAQSDAQTEGIDPSSFFPGLYPEYVHDLASFRDPNNPSNGDYTAIATVTTNVLGANGALSAKNDTNYYVADAYDISPRVTGTNQLAMTNYVPRYQRSWTDMGDVGAGALPNSTPPGGLALDVYTHQMRWRNPPADTYVTSTTYHVPNADIVLVLWEGGNVRKLNTQQFMQFGGVDAPSGIGVAGGVSQADFWKLTPAQ